MACTGDHLGTVTNNSGGIQGGISNAEPIIFRVAFKPPATISKTQHTANINGDEQVWLPFLIQYNITTTC